MNIFATYPCPERSAWALDDQRVVKMILESCQILSTVAHHYGQWTSGYPRPTHHNHPCVLWTAVARSNFDWLLDHCWALDIERRRRYHHNNVHRTLQACADHHIQHVRRFIPYGSTPHVNCARNRELGIDFTHVPDTHLAYRKYLNARWKQQARPPVCTILGLYHDKNWRS